MNTFCTCSDLKCPFNPANHNKGCSLCIAKCLKKDEIPSCFFKKVSDSRYSEGDYSFQGFASWVKQNVV